MAPIISLLYVAEIKSVRNGTLRADVVSDKTYAVRIRWFIDELDLFALLLLAASWVLIFLPFSLSSTAIGGWGNPSMIAMIVCGIVILGLFGAWEAFGSRKPMMNRRIVLNSTFLFGVGIDFFYFFTSYLADTYYLTYVLIVKNWSTTQWTNYGQTVSYFHFMLPSLSLFSSDSNHFSLCF